VLQQAAANKTTALVLWQSLLLQNRQCPANFQEQCNPEEAFFKARLKRATTAKRFADASNASTAHAGANHTAVAAPPASHGKRRLAAAAAAAAPAQLGGTASNAYAADEAHAVCDGGFLVRGVTQ
jgi:hypothetical protein